MARSGMTTGLGVGAAGFVCWILFSLASLKQQQAATDALVHHLESTMDRGFASVSSKLDLAMSRLAHIQPGGFHDKSAAVVEDGDGDPSKFSAKLDKQLQRLTQGVQAVDNLKTRLDTALADIDKSHLMSEKACAQVLDKACKANGGGGGGGGGGVSSRRSEPSVIGEKNLGPPARLPGEKQDAHASEALSQQTIKMNPGDPIPFVGKAYHPWFSNADHSHKPMYAHLLKDKWGAKRKCRYIDVLFWNKVSDRCALIVPDREIKSRTITAEIDPMTGVAMHPPEIKRDTNPLDIRPRDNRYWAFIQAKDEMVNYLRQLVGTGKRSDRMAAQANPKPLVVMCANDGHVGLLLNWACSLRAANIDMPKHVVFATNAKLRDYLRSLGFTAYYHDKMGSFPKQASAKYSDPTFGAMMILKQVSVALALETGYDVLFQDIDITWVHDPRPELLENSKYYEVQFQDDGARNAHYQPWFANTGFFYMRASYMTRDFWDRVTQAMPSYPQSNQVILNWVLEGFEARGHPVNNHKFPIKVLPQDEYVAGNGVDLLGVRNPGQSHVSTKVRPLSPTVKIVHFCWTHNITYKLGKMKGYNALYVKEGCIHDWETCIDTPNSEWADEVCQHAELPPFAESYETWLKAH